MPTSDAELIRRCLEQKDDAAFRGLVERHADAVLRTARAVTRDRQAAEDATQETFVVLARKLRKFDTSRSLKPWLLGIAFRCASKIATKRARAARREERAMRDPTPKPAPDDAAQRREVLDAVDDAIADLPPQQRAAVQLHYGEGLSHTEVAASLGVAAGTAKSRIGRALASLRETLRGRGHSVAVAELPLLLKALPQPTASTALIEACAGKGLAAAVALPVAHKVVAAAALIGATTVASVSLLAEDDPAPRETRAHVDAPHDERDAARTGTAEQPDAAGAARATEERGGEVAEPVDAGDEKGPFVTIGGKRYSIHKLPKNVQFIRTVKKDGKVRLEDAKGNRVAVGGRGGFGGLMPPKHKLQRAPRHYGDGRVTGRVVDTTGAPVPGAQIWRIADDADRSEATAISAAHMDEIGKTDDAGRFALTRQRHGTFLLFANFQGVLNVPMVGLETKHAVEVRLEEGGVAENVVLTVPVTVGDFGRLRGRLVDEAGRPLGGGTIMIDMRVRRYADREGRFDAGLLPAGTHELEISRTGFQDHFAEVEVHARGDAEVTLTLKLKEKGGLRVAGTIVDDAGNPVPHANLFLMADNGTLRRGRSGPDGRYAFDELPDDLPERGPKLAVWAMDRFEGKHIDALPVPADPYEIRLTRIVQLKLRARGSDGEFIRSLNGKLLHRRTRDGAVEWFPKTSWGSWKESGTWSINAPVGKPLRIQVEAEHHETLELELTFAAEPFEQELILEMIASAEQPEPVPGD